jgi:uncharacterized Tic20 family protein
LQLPILSWAKSVCCKDVPPSRSLLAWRLMHDKIPTVKNLCREVVAFLLNVFFAIVVLIVLFIFFSNATLLLLFGVD